MTQRIIDATPIVGDLWDSCLSYISRNPVVTDQKHYCYKIAVSLDHSVNCKVNDFTFVAIRGFMVNQRASHQCAAPEGPVLNIMIEPDSRWGKVIKSILDKQDFLRFEDIMDVSEISPIFPPNYMHLPNAALMPDVERLIKKITGKAADKAHTVDERIQKVRDYVSSNLAEEISKEEILNSTFLSFERTRHLFAEEMGIPLSRYIVWQKIRKTLSAIVQGETNLSDASQRYGFVDLSHFNKTFKQIFGINPSTFFLESRVII